MIRHFEIRTPRADYDGTIAGARFLDGRTRVKYDDDPDMVGHETASHSLVLYARRKAGYTVTELDAQGQPLTEADAQ